MSCYEDVNVYSYPHRNPSQLVSFKVGCYELLELEVLTLEEILFSSLCFECTL
jgi:hypothetical protein